MPLKRYELLKIPITFGLKIEQIFQLLKIFLKYDIDGHGRLIVIYSTSTNSKGLFYAGHSAGPQEDREGRKDMLTEKTGLWKRQVITQRITNFKKCYKGKVQDALRTRNRENN